MSDIGKYLPELTSKQVSVAEKAAEYLGTKPVYPTWTGFDPELLGTPVMGYEAEKSAIESAIGPNVVIAYNPDIVKDPKLRKKVATHEGVHLAQRGKRELLKLYASTPFGIFSIGHALVEGGNELVTEKIGEEKSGAYHKEYQFAKRVNDYVMDLGSIHEMAEYRGADALAAFLSKPKIKEKLYKAFLESYMDCARN
ncbi:MAG: hypothetical protein NT129_06335, partial [Candidatus Aenigmarchaeota archaeon]|nr:hypothetical protein [Candidatus Aenigmarchaeota archaeon]